MHAFGIDQSSMNLGKLAQHDDVLAYTITIPVLAALAINKPTGIGSTDTGAIQASAARVLAVSDVACAMAVPGMSSRAVLLKNDRGTLKAAVYAVGTDPDFVPLGQFTTMTTRVPVVEVKDNPLQCVHKEVLDGETQWQPMTYEQWIRWHFDTPPGLPPKDQKEFPKYEEDGFNFACFLLDIS